MMHDLNGEPGLKGKYLDDCISWAEKRISL
jgi:hypothetical protein